MTDETNKMNTLIGEKRITTPVTKYQYSISLSSTSSIW